MPPSSTLFPYTTLFRSELVFIDDFIAAMRNLAETVDNELVNIGAGEEFTIRHFANLICEYVGFDFNAIQFDTSRYVGEIPDRKSTRLNSSHTVISYAVF